jgi:hypothetical protein
VFAAAAVELLGHRVDQDGVRLLQRHVQAISDFPPHQDVKQLQQFLGMVNFYTRFLPGIARTLQPLTDALKGAPKTLDWPPAAAAAFGVAKAALAAAEPLAHPAPNVVLSLTTAPPTTSSSSLASSRPLCNARPPNRLNLCGRQVWGDLWWRTICSYCVSRLNRHVTY